MYKTYVIAWREFRSVVRSKGFVISLLAMPIMMGGAIVVQLLLKDKVDTQDKRFAIVDAGGQFQTALAAAAESYNQTTIFEGQGANRKKVKPGFILEFVKPQKSGDPLETTLALSERVRRKELVGFLTIDENVVAGNAMSPETNPPPALLEERPAKISYYSQNAVENAFRFWAANVLNQEVQRLRSQREGIDPQALQRVIAPVAVQDLGLVARDDVRLAIAQRLLPGLDRPQAGHHVVSHAAAGQVHRHDRVLGDRTALHEEDLELGRNG